MCTFSVTVAAESVLFNNNPIMKHSNPLDDWIDCKFTGKENFKEISQIQPQIKSIHKNLSFVLLIPRMESLFCVLYRQDSYTFIMSLQMAFNTFIRFNQKTYCCINRDILECGFITHSNLMRCGRCYDNNTTTPTSRKHLAICSYNNSKLDGVPTQQIIATSVKADYTVKMYEKAMVLATNGNLGKSLLPPRLEL